jgi:beta-aspartyl-peptidase (threonine type)
MTPEREAAYRASLEAALRAGYDVLRDGGSALDAVTAAIPVLEDDSLFNAGKGAVFTNAGTVELDASIMDGATLNAGAVAGVESVRNPILLARRVMEESPHVLLVGDGAEAFAEEQGFEAVPNEYFYTARRRAALERVQERERSTSGGAQPHGDPEPWQMTGTVGAVALDQRGHLAAATSTGGMTNKRWGRVGDSPIIAAGTYADDRTCAISATGHGEYFIRLAIAHDISARMMYLGESVSEASHAVIHERLTDLGGTGGVIAMDGEGRGGGYADRRPR